MPYTDVLSWLKSSKAPATDYEWSEILKARKTFMMQHIRELGQKKLGDVYIWRTRGELSTTLSEDLADKNLTSPDKKKFNMNTRGVFFFDRSIYICVDNDPRHVSMAVCGFTRSGDWLIARIESKLDAGGNVEKKRVVLEEAGPMRWIELGIEPQYILYEFTKYIRNYAENREFLTKEAQKMYWQAEMEDRLILNPRDML
jgi:hypothetical protein